MNRVDPEKIQAWVDGQLDPSEAATLADRVEQDADGQALARNLRQLSQLLRQHEPSRPVPDSREFYWAGIRRGIEQAAREREQERSTEKRPASWSTLAWRWLAWGVPVGAAALAAFFTVHPGTSPGDGPSDPGTRAALVPRLVGHEIESNTDQVTTLTFYSSQDAMTVVWLGEVDLL